MFRFENPELLWLLGVVPVALVLRWLVARRRPSAVVYSSLAGVRQLRGGVRRLFRWIPIVLRTAAVICAVVALARPQHGEGKTNTTTSGIAMMICVDRSGSMLEGFPFENTEIPKIDAVKRVFRQFVQGDGSALKGRPDDIIGLVTFARFADTVCPMVREHEALVKLMDDVKVADPRVGNPEAGTSIGDGVALGAARLKDVERELIRRQREGKPKSAPGEAKPNAKAEDSYEIKSKAIILLTDGEENTGELRAVQAAELCRQWGIKVYAIGIGAGGSATMRTPSGQIFRLPGRGFDDGPLKEVARITGGRYWPANDAATLREIYKEIDQLEKTEIKQEEFTTYDERFRDWAAAAVLCLGLELLLSATLLRRVP